VLSLSTWRDEKALIRWRTLGVHHEVQEKGRFEVFEDYHDQFFREHPQRWRRRYAAKGVDGLLKDDSAAHPMQFVASYQKSGAGNSKSP
jgi:hypothetical protein